MIPGVLHAHGVDLVWLALLLLALAGSFTSTVYLVVTLVATGRHLRRARVAQADATATPISSLPPVTIFKPVHGMEEQLAANLESFFQQDYPEYEVIFGVRDADNPAAKIAEEIRARYPHVPSRLIVSGPPAWPNAKVFSLDKMIAASSRSYFIISDSDVQVAPDFLRNTIPPLLDPKVGLVTCMYRGIPAVDFWSGLEALGLSVEMSSGVMVADMMEGMRFALGPAMAVRRDAIDAIGGIAAVADYYSDDFELGNRIWAKNYKVILSHHIVRNVLTSRSPIAHARRSAAMDEEHALFAARRTCGHGPDLRSAFWDSGIDRCRGAGLRGARDWSVRAGLLESDDSVGGGGMERGARSAGGALLLAVSAAGFLRLRGVGSELYQQGFLLARGDVSLRQRRKNRAAGEKPQRLKPA